MPVLLVAVGGLLAAAALGWRVPVARRLAVARLRRRWRDGLLLVAGGALGTALITGSLLVGDTLQASLTQRALVRLGPVDVVVRSFAPVIADAVQTTLEFNAPPAADGTLDVTAADGSVVAVDGTVVPGARLLEFDFAEAAGFGGDAAATGITGPTPGSGGVVLTADLAERLGVSAGATVEVIAYGRSRPLTVERVLAARGLAGFASSFAPEALNAFLAPGFLRQLAFDPALPPAAGPPERLALLSGDGDVLEGARRSAELVGQLQDRFATFPGFDIAEVKREALDAAREDAALYAELFTSLAVFAVLAGIALLANLFVMLIADRRAELGVLRAVGVRRRDLWLCLALEGTGYALASGALGSLAGVGVARLLVAGGANVLSGVQRGGVELSFAVRPTTVLTGAVLGALVAVTAMSVTALRIGRGSVVEALRDLPLASEPRPGRRGLVLGSLAVVVLAVGSAAAFAAGDDLGRVALPSLTVCAVTFTVLRRPGAASGEPQRSELLVTLTALAVLVWSGAALRVLDVDDTAVGLFAVQGVALTLAGVVLLTQRTPQLARAAGRLPGLQGLGVRLGLAYPAARPGRSMATLTTYSVVVYVLVFSAVLSSFFSSQVRQLIADEGGGADLLVTTGSSAPVPPDALAAVPGVAAVASFAWEVAEFRVGGAGVFEPWALSRFSDDLLSLGPPRLDTWDTAAYRDEDAVWRAVLADPGLAVADAAFLQRGGGPPQDNVAVGDDLELRAPGSDTVTRLRVVAISAAATAFSGVLAARATAPAASSSGPFGAPPEVAEVLNRHHVALAEGAEPAAVAGDLERAFLLNGLEARSFEEVVRDALADQEAFFDLIESYLALGLLVGIGGVGVVAARAVRERRRELAILRAVGVSAPTLRRAVLLEAGLVAVQGTLLGAGLALLGGYQLVTNNRVFDVDGAGFSVPWTLLVTLLVGVGLAGTLAALPPALQVVRRPVADGLRLDAPGG